MGWFEMTRAIVRSSGPSSLSTTDTHSSMEMNMPLLLCPNDNASMTTVNRSGVEFDMCPSCRGVWLDRGELEKLIEAGGGQGGPATVTAQPALDRDFRHQRDDDYGRDEGYRRKKRRDIFDIFD